MKGIKCPICLSISVIEDFNEGEMTKCSYCKAKYTVIKERLYGLVPHGKRIGSQEDLETLMFKECIEEFDNEYLLQIMKTITDELLLRCRKK
ncbi:MAG: hypothetical protein CVU87_08065 [Firmicutes bacterium HGW-Firmicutes-12]|jgi:hypothetical protein|nr:MAG: hypothetical protein CVU87_08065 [Firmicutes bacterium HGW-Firmicutes-12]